MVRPQAPRSPPLTARRALTRLAAALLLVSLLTALSACSGSEKPPAATPTITATLAPFSTPTLVPTPTPTVNPLGPPDASGARALAYVLHLSTAIGSRPAGTEAERAAAGYLADELRRFGYTVEVQPFPFSNLRIVHSSVDLPATGESLPGASFAGSASARVTAPLRRVAVDADLDSPALAGAIAIVPRGLAANTTAVARTVAAGAAGVLFVNSVDSIAIDTLAQAFDIPVVGVSASSGERLAAAADAGASATITVPPTAGTSQNVFAGPPDAQCETVSGAHYDSAQTSVGANDNASGAGTVIEIARAVAAANARGRHCFVLFGAEEPGLLGSEAFVAGLTAEQRGAIRYMVNYDVVGGGEQGILVAGNPAVVDAILAIARAKGVTVGLGQGVSGSDSDHASFRAAGIAVAWFYTPPFGYIHTPADNPDRIDARFLGDVAVLGVAFLLGM